MRITTHFHLSFLATFVLLSFTFGNQVPTERQQGSPPVETRNLNPVYLVNEVRINGVAIKDPSFANTVPEFNAIPLKLENPEIEISFHQDQESDLPATFYCMVSGYFSFKTSDSIEFSDLSVYNLCQGNLCKQKQKTSFLQRAINGMSELVSFVEYQWQLNVVCGNKNPAVPSEPYGWTLHPKFFMDEKKEAVQLYPEDRIKDTVRESTNVLDVSEFRATQIEPQGLSQTTLFATEILEKTHPITKKKYKLFVPRYLRKDVFQWGVYTFNLNDLPISRNLLFNKFSSLDDVYDTDRTDKAVAAYFASLPVVLEKNTLKQTETRKNVAGNIDESIHMDTYRPNLPVIHTQSARIGNTNAYTHNFVDLSRPVGDVHVTSPNADCVKRNGDNVSVHCVLPQPTFVPIIPTIPRAQPLLYSRPVNAVYFQDKKMYEALSGSDKTISEPDEQKTSQATKSFIFSSIWGWFFMLWVLI